MFARLTGITLCAAAILAVAPDTPGGTPRGCTIKGTSGSDVLAGTGRRDVICAGEGDDVIRGGAGADAIYAGRGNDVIYPGAGPDLVFGESGYDTIFAVDGARDVLFGGPDRDSARIDRDRVRSVERLFRRESGALLLAAGDIATCVGKGDDRTAVLLDAYPSAVVAPLGDTVYESGTAEEYARCYAPTWGRAKRRSRPASGDHEYATPGASGYFGYFGAAAGPPGKGYYSYGLGRWHIVVLNTNCTNAGGCGPNAPETQWLRADLAGHASRCTLAYFHSPRFSSGTQGPRVRTSTFFQILYEAGAELVLSGDDHFYERFAPQSPAGAPDPAHGIRQFVVGTGGKSFSPFGQVQPQSEVRNDRTFGVLKLNLRTAGYSWEFVPVAGDTFTDRGSQACH